MLEKYNWPMPALCALPREGAIAQVVGKWASPANFPPLPLPLNPED